MSITGIDEPFDKSLTQLRRALDELPNIPDLQQIQDQRERVLQKYGRMFNREHLPALSAEEFQSFLRFDENQHWSGIHRHGGKISRDMDGLREALAIIHDEKRPLPERYDDIRQRVKGLGKAVLTPIMLVAYPDRYGVWNGKSEAGLRQLNLFPSFSSKETEGEQYEAVNQILNRLAEELRIDLWTLDTLWESLTRPDEPPNGLAVDRRPTRHDRMTLPEEKLMSGNVVRPSNDPTIAREFRGFTIDAFDFLRDLQGNNNKAWMDANRERWHANILEPMRALFADLGPHLKAKFDPYLNPDELEIRPTARYVLARINKNWSATEYSKYHEYYWGAFYRARLTKQTDAQLFVNLLAHTFRFGFYVGEMAKSVRERFQQRVQDDSQAFWELVNRLELAQEFEFVRTHEEDQREVIGIRTADDIHHWVESGDFDLLQRLAPEEAVTLGPALADRIFDALRRVFPVYLWAVAGNPALLVDQYLAAEFPPDEFDDLEEPPTPYTRAEFLRDTHLTAAAADELIEVLQEKKQLIFYGPPGTGKTWVARHLGRLLTGLADPSPERLTVVQFHPAYGYEEFIEGIRPRSEEHDGRRWVDYPTRPGVFVRFCREAARVAGPCVFIIDEINRGNIPRIFGELMLLLEYRDLDVPLPYSGERFRIPPNVYVIGTMNTADRSIALVDFALRRRFHFAKFAADPDLFARWLAAREGALPYLGALYRRLSEEAIDDPNFAIGPSAFMREGLDEAVLARIWRRSVIPYLEEYYFDQPAKARRWDWDGELVRGIREGWGD